MELLAEFDVVAPDVSDILAAIDLHRLHQISFWDAIVVRAAGQAGCPELFSETCKRAATSTASESLTRSKQPNALPLSYRGSSPFSDVYAAVASRTLGTLGT